MGSNARAGSPLSELTLLLKARQHAFPPADWTHTESAVHPDRVFKDIAGRPYPVYLWGHAGHERGRYSIVTHSPFAVVQPCPEGTLVTMGARSLRLPGDGAALCLRLVAECAGEDTGQPFRGGAIGYVTYEHSLDYLGLKARHAEGPLPAYHFALYDHAYVYDHLEERGLQTGGMPAGPGERVAHKPLPARLGTWTSSVSEAEYMRHIAQILAHIEAGDIYQANYTARFSAPGRADRVDLALLLKARNPAPMGACLHYPFGTIWSSSPERLISGQWHGRLESVPIKGTRGRESNPEADTRQVAQLLNDPKERAELLMIVDLVRNDLGRTATLGSVTVDELYRVRSYANVHHLEATVSAQMSEQATWDAVLKALLPGGSITGAPKHRAARILQELEPVPRSVYTGALGYVSFEGHADFSIPIRTLYHDGTHFHLHSGGGIVADSDPTREYEELQLKVANIRAILEEACRST